MTRPDLKRLLALLRAATDVISPGTLRNAKQEVQEELNKDPPHKEWIPSIEEALKSNDGMSIKEVAAGLGVDHRMLGRFITEHFPGLIRKRIRQGKTLHWRVFRP